MARGKRRAPVEIDRQDADGIAQQLNNKRLKATTRRTYSFKLKRLSDWLSLYHPACIGDESNSIKLPLEKCVVLEFFGSVCAVATKLDKAGVNDGELGVPLSPSCVKGFRSAIVDLYKSENKQLDEALDRELNVLLDGYDKLINDLRKRGLMKIHEGKQYLKSSGYSMLAWKLLTQKPEKAGQSWSTITFSWAYFVTMWNLMSRSDSVDSIMLQHLDWVEDSLVVEEQGHKGDQTGSDKYWKHIYANPYEPHICPILVISVLLFCYCDRPENGKQQLFCGNNNKSRFGDILRKTLRHLSESEIQTLGTPTEDIAAHSLRKGNSTYTLGQVNGPSPVTVFLRMGQSLGRLKGRYIHYGEGADQLCGRMVSGLPFDSIRFGVLPPRFKQSVLERLDRSFWESIVPGYSNYSNGVRSTFPFLLASLFHHEQFLRENLPPGHPIFFARVLTQNRFLDVCRGGTVITIGRSDDSGFKCSGIPPHLAISREVFDVCGKVDKLEHEVARLRCNSQAQLPESIADKVSASIRSNFAINGALPLTLHDIESRMNSLRADIINEIHRTLQADDTAISDPARDAEPDVAWKSWDWRDGFISHCVPHGWDFPTRINVKTLYDLWHYGDREQMIRPYRYLKNIDIKAAHKMRLLRAKAVVQRIDQLIATQMSRPARNASRVSIPCPRDDAAFGSAYREMLEQLYSGKTPARTEEISYGKIYNLLCAFRKRQITSVNK